jgi:hypothetical protein
MRSSRDSRRGAVNGAFGGGVFGDVDAPQPVWASATNWRLTSLRASGARLRPRLDAGEVWVYFAGGLEEHARSGAAALVHAAGAVICARRLALIGW